MIKKASLKPNLSMTKPTIGKIVMTMAMILTTGESLPLSKKSKRHQDRKSSRSYPSRISSLTLERSSRLLTLVIMLRKL